MTDYLDCLYGEEPAPEGPLCEVDCTTIDTYGGEHERQCGRAGTITVDGTLMCEDHAGERGYGPKQEEYGYDPDDSPESGRIAPEDRKD
ncbi:MAG TPA: hypothetical protein VGS62_06870 [Streptosporangiaceae bacterium]|nr:hypothetical protein [Streptosporangiaceae bacterium]